MYDVQVHGSTAEIIIEDVDPVGLFSEALLGTSDVLSDATGGTPVTHEVRLGPAKLEGLLEAWLQELVRLAEVDGFIPERLDKERLESTTFSARIAGVRDVPREEIRAVRFRGLETKRLDDGAWAAKATLEVA
jgi:SHS2 domain-containing protein